MSKRLQVVVGDAELRDFRKAAKRAGVTLSEWVRQTLRRAQRETDVGDPGRKLEALRRGLQHGMQDDVPSPDIDQMLEEIERGYQQDLE
jgi:hypothetical protein